MKGGVGSNEAVDAPSQRHLSRSENLVVGAIGGKFQQERFATAFSLSYLATL
jgi:hypothetical protein